MNFVTSQDQDDSAIVLGWSPNLISRLHEELESRNPLRALEAVSGDAMPRESVDWMERINRVPSVDLLGVALGIAYRSTLTLEEGRPTTFRLVFVERSLAVESGWLAIGFADPLTLTVDNVRRIAPAANAHNAFIAVDTADGEPHLWGIIRVPRPEVGENRLPGVVIRGLGPGRLTVTSTRSEVLIIGPEGALLLHDERPADFNFLTIISDALVMPGRPFAPESAVLLRVALALREHGHGGTLLIVDPERAEGHGTKLKYSVGADTEKTLATHWTMHSERNGENQLSRRLQRVGDISDLDGLLDRQARQSLTDGVSLIAGLSAVDGAILMTSDLTVLGFGAFIEMSNTGGKENVTEVNALNPAERRSIPRVALGGARHQSALAFVDASPATRLPSWHHRTEYSRFWARPRMANCSQCGRCFQICGD